MPRNKNQGGCRSRTAPKTKGVAKDTPEETQPSGFMRLPAELRMQIFEMVLEDAQVIEFCPEPFRFRVGGNFQAMSNSQNLEDYRLAANYHSQLRRDVIEPYAGYLRICKEVGAEASAVLYGKSEFRFTNTAGWLGLEYFLYSIGTENAQKIRHVTVLHPDLWLRPSSISNALCMWTGILNFKQIRADDRNHPAFGHGKYWYDEWDGSMTLALLHKLTGLRQLCLVIPQSVDLEDEGEHEDWHRDPIDDQRFGNLVKILVKKDCGESSHSNTSWEYATVDQIALRYNKICDNGWLVEDVHIDECGRYLVGQNVRVPDRSRQPEPPEEDGQW